jgi:hypothetical protein
MGRETVDMQRANLKLYTFMWTVRASVLVGLPFILVLEF